MRFFKPEVKSFKHAGVVAGLGCALVMASGSALGASSVTEAPVISAYPVYETVRINTPYERCWDEAVQVQSRASQSRTPEILGAIVGAAVGRNFGSGRGQDVATVAGAVLGGSIGRDVKHRRSGSRTVYQKRCETVDNYKSEERLQGYDVTYQYNGDTYTTFTDHDPGETIKVSVNVVPVE
ncbi:MAG: glycine zipper 2TM domain-containing protein [Pseudomonadota bacterium]